MSTQDDLCQDPVQVMLRSNADDYKVGPCNLSNKLLKSPVVLIRILATSFICDSSQLISYFKSFDLRICQLTP